MLCRAIGSRKSAMTCPLGSAGLTAMAHTSRFPWWITVTVRYRPPFYSVPALKSITND